MGNLILASASPRRKEIMELMGLRFIVQPSQCEEIVTETIPENIVIELSRQKAIDVAKTAQPGDVIIGSDTIVVLRQQKDVSESKEMFEVLGKPRDREHGFRMLVPEYTNSTFDNAFMTAEQTYRYYNEFMWKGRYAECISVGETIERMKG